MRFNIKTKYWFAFVLVIAIIPLIYSLINTSQAYHSADKIVNSGGRVFNDQGIAYLCDSLSDPATSSDVTSNVGHSIQQFSRNSSDLNSIDSNNNGWPDKGIALVGSFTPTQLPAGSVFHNISEIKRGISGAENKKIDSNGNGWPDKCDALSSVSFKSLTSDTYKNSWDYYSYCQTNPSSKVLIVAHLMEDWDMMARSFLEFDTSSLQDNAIILGATLKIYITDYSKSGGSLALPYYENDIYVHEGTWGPTIDSLNCDEFDAKGALIGHAIGPFTINNYLNIPLTSFSNINKSSHTYFTIKGKEPSLVDTSEWYKNQHATIRFSSSNELVEEKKPELIINYII